MTKGMEMGTRAEFLRPDARASTIYTRATIIFNEKREMLTKLSVLNHDLRRLQRQDADAVAAARVNIPFRNWASRKKANKAGI